MSQRCILSFYFILPVLCSILGIFVLLQEWLTKEFSARYVLRRGLIRVRCIYELGRIIRFLTWRGVINTGLLPGLAPEDVRLPPQAVKVRSISKVMQYLIIACDN
jgi:hypothetical protein